METTLKKLKTNPLGQIIWIAIMCGLHLLLFKSKVNYDIAAWKRILLLLLAILVSLPVHEFIHLVFMKVFSKGNAKIDIYFTNVNQKLKENVKKIIDGEVKYARITRS